MELSDYGYSDAMSEMFFGVAEVCWLAGYMRLRDICTGLLIAFR